MKMDTQFIKVRNMGTDARPLSESESTVSKELSHMLHNLNRM